MNATAAKPFPYSRGALLALGLLAALIVVASLSGWNLPWIANDRTALVVLMVVSLAMCSQGIGRVAARRAWAHPLSILGYLLGAAILGIAAAALLGIPLPWVASVREAIRAVAVLGVVKLVLSTLHLGL